MTEYKIKFKGKEFNASEYQNKILDFVEHGSGNGFINACAGASKTTMLENMLYYIPKDQNGIFIAFNKSIVDEMESRINNTELKDKIKICTYHSLGYSILKENIKDENKLIINEDKYKNFVNDNILELSNYGEISTLKNQKYAYKRNIIHLVDYARYYRQSSVKHMEALARQYGLSIIRDEIEVARKVLQWGKDNIDEIDYTDMIWLVDELNLTTKKYLYNFILIDEAQDTSIMQQEMTEKCKKRGCRVFAVGDKDQAINVWCGSDVNAIEKLKGANSHEFMLPITYRCGKKIVEKAREYSQNIVAAENAPEGEVNKDVPISTPSGNDMVLCRNTAPLVEYYLKLLQMNKKAYFKGSDSLIEEYKTLINENYSKMIDKNCLSCDGLIPKLYSKLFQLIDNIKLRTLSNDDEEAMKNPVILKLYDNIKALEILSDGIYETNELLQKIIDIFSDRSTIGIMLSTVHKAKGLEADTVFILCPSTLPSKLAKKQWEIDAENHLTYVAYTRAKYSLNFLEEDKRLRSSSLFSFKKMKKTIEEMREKLNYNVELNITAVSIPKHTPSAHTLGEKTFISTNEINSKNKKIKGGLKFRNLL